MTLSIILPLLLQSSATPYGSPLPDTIMPERERDKPTVQRPATNLPGPQDEARFEDCLTQAPKNPIRAERDAGVWLLEDDSYLARYCLALAQAEQQSWSAAEGNFAQAAQEAARQSDPRAARIWVLAGNAAMASGKAQGAVGSFTAALAVARLSDASRADVLVERARAYVGLENAVAARTDLDEALQLSPGNATIWLLSATLARREGGLARATSDIAKAAELMPDDPAVLLEQGNIAYFSDDDDAARVHWGRASRLDPKGDIGKLAAERLARINAAAGK